MAETLATSIPNSERAGASASLKYFRVWAALLFLICFVLGPLVLFTFGFFCFAILSILWLSEPTKKKSRTLDKVNGSILIIAAVWFLYNLVLETVLVYSQSATLAMWLPLIGLAFLFPPIIMHGAYEEHVRWLEHPSHWTAAYRVAYPVSFGLALLSMSSALVKDGPLIVRLLVFLQLANFSLFSVTGIYGFLISRRASRGLEREKRPWHTWNLFLYSLAALLFIGLIAMMILRADLPIDANRIVNLASIFARSLPLAFFFIGSYYENRFTFFDVFIKRGTFLFLLFILLVVFLGLVMPHLGRAPETISKPRLLALFLLPLLMTLPALYRALERFLDRAWLGRIYSTVEGMKYFLSGLQDATSEAEMIERAEARLSEIFQAQARVIPASGGCPADPGFESVCEVPMLLRGERAGIIRMGRRTNDTPYFSADLALLGSLAEVISSLVENVRLQRKKLEQEKREQVLMLHASRSELKALRAQINPHFLFNALNAIAGLIPRDPERAEETVERLAEVFRYTLRRSESESVRLEEELDFVRAYLEIEQARFGQRLRIDIDVAGEVNGVVVPTMMVQTLVENAVKHGVAATRGTGVVRIRAFTAGTHILIEVRDNGPGFHLDQAVADLPGRSGYGLRNLVQRLSAHYGAEASLGVRRDEAAGETVVVVELPAIFTCPLPDGRGSVVPAKTEPHA